MEIPLESTNLILNQKILRKIQRKLKKYIHMVEKNEGITSSNDPTQVVVVGNTGLTVGVSREDILEEFMQYGILEDVIMVPQQPYCFIRFKNVDDAKIAVKSSVGLPPKVMKSFEKPLYLFFVKSAPKIKQSHFWEFPPGLKVIENFVDEATENLLLQSIDIGSSDLKHRRVKHFGFEFLYNSNNVDAKNPLTDQPIPSCCNEVLLKAMKLGLINDMPDQLTVNEYQTGQGIPPHVDTHSAFTETILSLSLESDVVMEFSCPVTSEIRHVLLRRRSLLVMSGESRYGWTHGIVPRKTDIIPCLNGKGITLTHRQQRTSFTFRKLQSISCTCKYFQLCDSQKSSDLAEDIKDNKKVISLEKLHVHDVYDQIAEHFSETRHKPWPKVVEFLEILPVGTVLLDLGCGNGKYFKINNSIMQIGTDRSNGLLKICSNRGLEVFTAEILSLPIKSNVADACICIAVIHHIASKSRRLSAIKEIIRILVPGGKALISVWAMEQQKKETSSNYVKKTKNQKTKQVKPENVSIDGLDLPVHVNRTEFKEQDMLVPWHLKNEDSFQKTYQRFYHLFREGELEELCQSIESVEVTLSYYDKGNWCTIITKKENSL